MSFMIQAACNSNKGCIRSNNEDNYYFNGRFLPVDNAGETDIQAVEVFSGEKPLFAVFDGVGGANYGEAASYAAASACASLLSECAGASADASSAVSALCVRLNDEVLAAQRSYGTESMGSTALVAYFGEASVTIGNLGDSRGYFIHGGQMRQISVDHSEVVTGYTPTGKKRKGALIQYLGVNTEEFMLEPSVTELRIEAGDAVLLCSDGLTDMVPEDEILSIIETSATARDAVEKLTAAALDNGGRDNVTIVICKVSGGQATYEQDSAVTGYSAESLEDFDRTVNPKKIVAAPQKTKQQERTDENRQKTVSQEQTAEITLKTVSSGKNDKKKKILVLTLLLVSAFVFLISLCEILLLFMN